MEPLETFLSAAPGGGRKAGSGWLVRCPVPTHDDKRPSVSVRERADGALLVYCHGGCRTSDILESLGLQFADLFPDVPSW